MNHRSTLFLERYPAPTRRPSTKSTMSLPLVFAAVGHFLRCNDTRGVTRGAIPPMLRFHDAPHELDDAPLLLSDQLIATTTTSMVLRAYCTTRGGQARPVWYFFPQGVCLWSLSMLLGIWWHVTRVYIILVGPDHNTGRQCPPFRDGKARSCYATLSSSAGGGRNNGGLCIHTDDDLVSL
jgi:hypothetical protein